MVIIEKLEKGFKLDEGAILPFSDTYYIELFGDKVGIKDRLNNSYILAPTKYTDINNGEFASPAIAASELSKIVFNEAGGSSAIPTTVPAYTEITDTGIYYLDTADATHDVGFYRRLEDGTIIFDITPIIRKNIAIVSNLTIPNNHNDYLYLVKANLTLTVSETLNSSFRASIKTVGGIATIVAGANCVIIPSPAVLQDGKSCTIDREKGTNNFYITGQID